MKNILVPTDFSKNAETALRSAIALAQKQNAKLILLHVFHDDYINSSAPFNVFADEVANAKKQSNMRLRTLSLKIRHAGGVKYEYYSVEGSVVEIILNTIKEKEIDLVVMGTQGINSNSQVIFGSKAAKLIEKATCPVIAVPEAPEFKPIRKITYATAYHQSDINILKKITEIAKINNAQINVLHVSENAESSESDKGAMKTFMNDVTRVIPYNNLSFQISNGKNIEKTIEKYIKDGSTDMLVMSTHHRDFFDKLFGKSITRHLVHYTTIPLMAFHYNSKTSVRVF